MAQCALNVFFHAHMRWIRRIQIRYNDGLVILFYFVFFAYAVFFAFFTYGVVCLMDHFFALLSEARTNFLKCVCCFLAKSLSSVDAVVHPKRLGILCALKLIYCPLSIVHRPSSVICALEAYPYNSRLGISPERAM